MMHRPPALVAIAIALVAIAGCGDDGVGPGSTSGFGYDNLSEKVDVLHNLERAINQRNVDRYLEVLDPDGFEFFSYAAAPGEIPALWDYDEERASITTMFRGGGGTTNNPIVAIDFKFVDFEKATWTQYQPATNPARYETTVDYTMLVKTEDETQYVTAGVTRAQIRIERQDVSGRMIWRVIEWYEVLFAGPNIYPSVTGVEPATWASLKALYRGNTYADLSEKVDLLHNLQRAMNDMNASRYIEVLNPDEFEFFLSPGDVGGPDNNPVSWGFSADSACARTMLGGGVGWRNNPILSIDLQLIDFENAVWVEFDPTSFPGQFETTVGYSFTMRTADETVYITSGAPRAQIRIRQADDGGKMIWRIVQWNDLAEQRTALTSGPVATEASSWGSIKALYRQSQ